MATVSNDPVENLEFLGSLIAHDVDNAVCSWLITATADAWFHAVPKNERAKFFVNNPANHNIVYSALKALEEQSIVSIYETLKDKHKLHSHDATIRRKDDLRLHRHAISHPGTVEWTDAKMQAFAEADRDGYDLRPALVWDLQRSINEELRKHGRAAHNESIVVTRDMASALHMIMDRARKPEFPIKTVDQVFAHLTEQAPKFQALLEKRPDGARDPERERAAAERRRARREKWAKLAADRAVAEKSAPLSK